jgi:hypothetical protein
VASLLAEYCKTSERTVFWNDDLKFNMDPFDGLQGNFFMQDWDFKVRLKIFGSVSTLKLMFYIPQFSSKCYGNSWNCNWSITLKSKTRLILHGEYNTTSIKRRRHKMRHLTLATPKANRGYS